MKIAVIGDIHSNLEAIQSVLEDIESSGVERILCLGDIIGYGPDPKEVVELLYEHGVESILGNHEYALSKESYFGHLNPSPQKSLQKNIEELDAEDITYLKNLDLRLIAHDALLIHGCPPKSPTAYLMDPSQKLLSKIFTSFAEQICFFGHTHNLELFECQEDGQIDQKDFVPGVHMLNPLSRYLINPGSVGQPRDGLNNHAKYLIWDVNNGSVHLKSIPYDAKTTAQKLRKKKYPDFNAERLLIF